MPDNLSNRGPADGSRVNVNEDHELVYWCKKFGCTPAQLKAAVDAVGVMADRVEAYLARAQG